MENTLSSPLRSSANNIVSIDSQSKQSMESIQNDYGNFLKFLNVNTPQVEKISLPDQKTLSQISNLNVASIFGSPGKLLSNLVGGSLDAGGFLGNMFPTKGTMGDPQKATNIKPPQPEIEGSTLKFGGLRSVGIANAIFSGLDFSKDLSGTQPINSPSGLSQNFAGEFLGSAINNSLIPVPGIGFVYSDVAGSFGMGGITPKASGEKSIEQVQQERIKAQELAQKSLVGGKGSFYDVIERFNLSVTNFENGIRDGLFGTMGQSKNQPMEDVSSSVSTSYDTQPGEQPTEPGTTYTAQGGDRPSGNFISPFGANRKDHIHQGVDFASSDASAPISVIQPGIVDTGYEGGYGNWVAIKHDNGVETFYGHLSKVDVKKGQRIQAGTVIGNQGSTGRLTAPHVHFEYRPAGPGTSPVNGRGVADNYFRFGGNIKVNTIDSKKSNTDADQNLRNITTNYQQPQTEKLSKSQITQTPQTPQIPQTPQSVQTSTRITQDVQNLFQQLSNVESAKTNLPVSPQSIQYYTSYNQPNAGASVIMPIIMGGGSSPGVQQKPIFIPVGNGDSGSGTIIMPGPSEGEVVNSLMKTILLTNLLGT